MNNEQSSKVKPWVSSQGPVLASANDLKKAAAINELLSEGAAILPQKETDPVLPFELGIFEQFSARLQPGIARIRLRRAIATYAAAKNYLLASAQPDQCATILRDARPCRSVLTIEWRRNCALQKFAVNANRRRMLAAARP
ncbi:ProQ/FINO family protein [Agrobacterium sp. LAD9]|uniref:ProQ/FINO family protein n=1 Tax=Agrobacterium sp. LAD9 TaxID=2055153 RepID=UPI001FCE7ED7|nr:ProQ/FINO family protein [Agrobacterium sp. LAD9]